MLTRRRLKEIQQQLRTGNAESEAPRLLGGLKTPRRKRHRSEVEDGDKVAPAVGGRAAAAAGSASPRAGPEVTKLSKENQPSGPGASRMEPRPVTQRVPAARSSPRLSRVASEPVLPAAALPDACGELHRVHVYAVEELPSVEDAEAAARATLPLLGDAAWHRRHEGVDTLRRLLRHAQPVALSLLPEAAPRLTQSAISLRSAVARNALLCIGEALAACDGSEGIVDGAMVDALLSRAAADKRFLRDAANGALKALAPLCATTATIFTLCRASRRHRHPLARQAAAALLARALRAAPTAVVAAMPDANPATTLAATTTIPAAAAAAAAAGRSSSASLSERAAIPARPQTAPAAAGEEEEAGSSFPSVGDDGEWTLGDLIATCAAHAQGRAGVERQAGAAAARAVAASVGKERFLSALSALPPTLARTARAVALAEHKKAKAATSRVPLRERILAQKSQ